MMGSQQVFEYDGKLGGGDINGWGFLRMVYIFFEEFFWKIENLFFQVLSSYNNKIYFIELIEMFNKIKQGMQILVCVKFLVEINNKEGFVILGF